MTTGAASAATAERNEADDEQRPDRAREIPRCDRAPGRNDRGDHRAQDDQQRDAATDFASAARAVKGRLHGR
jgi:hypothetical protein